MTGRRRRLLLGAGVLALVGVAVGSFVLLPNRRPPDEGQFRCLRLGMTRAEVEAVLGPAGDYTTGPVKPAGLARITQPGGAAWETYSPEEEHLSIVAQGARSQQIPGASVRRWESDVVSIGVAFDGRGRACWLAFRRTAPSGPRALLDRLRRLLPWW